MDQGERKAALVAFIATAKPVLCTYCGQRLSETNPTCTLCTGVPMDPDANIKEQRGLARRIIADVDRGVGASPNDAERLAELVLALDEWLQKGGFPPQWNGR